MQTKVEVDYDIETRMKITQKELYGTPSVAINNERKRGTVTDLPDGLEMSEDAAKRVLKAKTNACWNVVKAAKEAGCEIFANGLVVRKGAHKSYAAKSAEVGDVLTAEEYGMPPGKPVMYLILGSREHDLGIEESGGLSETLIYAVKVTVESASRARARTLARRAVRSTKIEYDALLARSYDDGRVTPADIQAAREKAEAAQTQLKAMA